MGNAISAAALWAAITAVELVNFLDPHPGAQPQPPHGGVRDLLLLAAAGGLFTAAAFIHRHVHHAGGAGPGAAADNRRLSDLFALLCLSAGALDFFIFVQPTGGSSTEPGERARALGLAALRALPAAATATFFLGMMAMLIVVGHIRAGGEGGGGVVVATGEAPVGLLLLTKMALAAVAALVFVMAVTLYGYCA